VRIEDLAGDPDFPRKLLDKKAFVRIDPDSGVPQLIRVEPNLLDGELLVDTVLVTIDEHPEVIMDRQIAETVFSEPNGCVPLEGFSDWKRKEVS
jgi:hypothetical protein